MTDKELLEAAARAAGYGPVWYLEDGGTAYVGTPYRLGGPVDYRTFSPLTDDGDALRLAVKLNIDVMHATGNGTDYGQSVTFALGDDYEALTERHAGPEDKLRATRRAIVRAAAAMAGDA